MHISSIKKGPKSQFIKNIRIGPLRALVTVFLDDASSEMARRHLSRKYPACSREERRTAGHFTVQIVQNDNINAKQYTLPPLVVVWSPDDRSAKDRHGRIMERTEIPGFPQLLGTLVFVYAIPVCGRDNRLFRGSERSTGPAEVGKAWKKEKWRGICCFEQSSTQHIFLKNYIIIIAQILILVNSGIFRLK